MIVYKITCLANNKVYIGQTIQDLETRFNAHCYKGSDCSKLARAIQKYGRENFIIEELESCNSMDNLNKAEIYWIKEYNSIENGYNLLSGGKNGKHSEETKKKMSKLSKERQSRPEVKAKISKKSKETSNRPEVKRKISEAAKKMHQDSEFKKKSYKAIKEAWDKKLKNNSFNVYIAICVQPPGRNQLAIYEKDKYVNTYYNQRTCAKELNIDYRNMAAALNGKRKTIGGYILEYSNLNNKEIEGE